MGKYLILGAGAGMLFATLVLIVNALEPWAALGFGGVAGAIAGIAVFFLAQPNGYQSM